MKLNRISIRDFAENILGISHELLKKQTVYIKFIVSAGNVFFDPVLFVNFEKTYGEGSLYHKDIADANCIKRGQVEGGASAAISYDRIRITGTSSDFGSIHGYEDKVVEYFENYFDAPVVI